MYASTDTAVPFALSLLVFAVLERITHVVVSVLLPVARSSDLHKDAASSQFVVSIIDFFASLFASLLYTTLGIASAVASSLFWATVLVALGSMVYVTYEQSPWVWTDLARAYNAYLGPFIQETLVAGLNLLNIVFRSVIPLWNGFFYFINRLLVGYLLPTMLGELPVFQSIGTSLFDFTKHLVYSLNTFVSTLVVECPAAYGDACFDLVNRTLDVMTPMADARQVVSHLVVLSHGVCGFADPLVDMLAYPFMDINFAEAVHCLVNAVTYLFFQVPDVTYIRCVRFGRQDPLLCTPDFDPVYAFLVSGLRSLGALLDNWLDVVYVIVQASLGWGQISCSASMLPSTADPGPVRASVFGGNQTVLVGLTGYLLAVTDGLVVAYEGNGKLRLGSWPALVNITYGVAAVTYGRNSDTDVTGLSSGKGTSTSLLGCACADDPSAGMQIQCSVLPFGGLLGNESGIVPVFFQGGGALQRSLRCSDVDVVVQSVRWPATRFSAGGSGSAPSVDCATSSTCNKVDATVWLIPRAGCDAESAVCNCFPYCMAARAASSQTAPLIFYSAQQWKGNVLLSSRDCVLHSVSSESAGVVGGSLGASGVSSVQVTPTAGLQFVAGVGGTFSCVDNLLVTAVVNRSLHPAYDTPTAAYLRNPAAPFAITGDTLLTAVQHGDGSYAVRVDRLTGDMGSEFTISVVSNNFPATPPPNVPSSLFNQYPRDSLTIPYARLGTLAVSSRDFVFFAVNPATSVFDAYLYYCRNKGQGVQQFGVIMESSYSPIRIWRVDAYRRCTVVGCGLNLVEQVDIPGAFSNGSFNEPGLFSSQCSRSFNDIITQLEYVDEINIAATVRYTDVNASFVQYRTYWLHVQTMQLSGPGLGRQGPWVDDAPIVALSAYTLCPSMQILPELGSLAMEMAIAGVFLVRMPLDGVLYTAGIINLWSSGGPCPLATHGHTVLQQCGAHAFSLDDFFDALQRATDIFWSIPVYVSSYMSSVHGTDFIQNTLNGVASYGAGSIDLWTVRFQVLGIMKAAPSILSDSMPTMEFFSMAKDSTMAGSAPDSSTMYTTSMTGVKQGAGMAQAAVKVGSTALGWARFGYTSMLKIVLTVVRSVVSNNPVSASGAWRIAVNTLDEVRDSYDSYVVDNMRQACGGLAMMNGINNPWAVFMYQQCMANVVVVESGVSVVLSIFNLAPFAQCMCSGSAGMGFGAYAMANCLPQASTTLRPVLLQMIQSAESTVVIGTSPAQQLCKSMIDYTNASLVDVVQPWFSAQYASLDALAASLDYALFWLDPTAGDCLDFAHDPDVVVIMPYPTDYFETCGKTTLCRMKCSGLWDAFNSALQAANAPVVETQLTVSAESLFFSSISPSAFTPMLVMAMIQPTPAVCYRVCGRSGDLCVAVGGTTGGVVVVQYYCVPMMMTATVYRTVDASLEWHIEASRGWSDGVTQLQFGDGDGLILVSLVGTGQVFMSNVYGTVLLTDTTQQSQSLNLQVLKLAAIMVVFNPPYACVSVNAVYRQVSGGITGQPMQLTLVVNTLLFNPRLPGNAYGPTYGGWSALGATPFFTQLQGYKPARLLASTAASLIEYLLIPVVDGAPAMIWVVEWDSTTVTNGIVGSVTPYLFSEAQGLGSLINSDQVLSQTCVQGTDGAFVVFASAPPSQSTSWLKQLRVSGVSAGIYSSQPVYVSVKVTRSCDTSSCVGCPDGEVKSLCYAMQQCAVVNCIGTRVNMRRPLCQIGQTIADYSRQNLAAVAGLWSMFVEIYITLMDLSLQKGITSVTLTFPDDGFFGYVCSMKDNNVHMVSIVTSALNGVLQLGHSSLLYIEGGAHDIDSNFNAMTTMPLTAFTGFISQWMMAPLYALIVTQKVFMCKINGVLAVFDSTGYSLRIGDASFENASDFLVGQCLTQNFVVKNNNPADSGNAQSVARIVDQVSQSAALAMLPQLTFQGSTMETMMHVIDSTISYYVGVLFSLADMLESLDMSHCKLPDYFLNETVFCACGDAAFAIPAARRSEGISDLGLWCSGTLTMLDASNQPFVVYNPYSYQELQGFAEGSDAYLACMSSKAYVAGDSGSDCSGLRPTAPALQAQGVSVLTVLTTCKRNYMQSRWDPSAFVLFNQSLFDDVVRGVSYPNVKGFSDLFFSVGACLSDPSLRAGCLSFFLMNSVALPDPVVYWSYENAAPGPSQLVDACQVFTGPANSSALTGAQRGLFRACLDQYQDSSCQLAPSLWTPQSTNAIPVASMHGVRLVDAEHVSQIVQLKFAEAYALVMTALKPLQSYSNSDTIALFFSPEGDIMHQMLDCTFMGPYSSVGYWPSDSHGLLQVPRWFRDQDGSSRAVDPATCVQGAIDTDPPYSCGSPTRQAVIKYFFRDYLQGSNNNAVIGEIIASMVDDLTAAWNDTSKYACLCNDLVTHSTLCCVKNASAVGVGAWLPPSLSVESQYVPSNSILRALTGQVETFYRVSLENPAVWTKYLDAGTLGSYDWSLPVPSAVATREALFRTDTPSIKYDASEVNSPMLTTALWDQCHGLLSKIFFTVPMESSASGQWVPKDAPAGSIDGVDAVSAFVRAAVQGAYDSSPLFRHYNVSHVPSDSRMCQPVSPVTSSFVSSPPKRWVNLTSYGLSGSAPLLNAAGWPGLPSFGVDAFPVHGCFCGWDGNGTTCFPPRVVAAAMPELSSGFSGQSAAVIDAIKRRWVPGWPCPALQLGDQFGMMDAGEYDDWLAGVSRNYVVSGGDLLRRGRSGMRVGSFKGISSVASGSISPKDRILEPSETVLPYCGSDYARLSGAPLLDAGMLRAFVVQLFPVAQGVFESGTGSYCLRYFVESALLEALSLVSAQVQNASYITGSVAAQQKVVGLWRARCESQISLLSLCKNLDVFHPPVDRSKRFQSCPFSISANSNNDVYMTPGCLVHSGGVFYDPCNCAGFTCGPSAPLFNQFKAACAISFDPRNHTLDAPLGAWRTSGGPTPVDLLKPDFLGTLLGTGDAVGNVPRGSSWSTSEGFLNVTGLHCDMLTDWWPDGQTLPVGYHATVPCSSDDVGYRTFDSAFAVERGAGAPGEFTVVKLVYQHDLTRDASKVDTHLGAGGLCRSSTLGMPLYQSNTMRLCTRQLAGDDTLDPAIPGNPYGTPVDSAFSAEVCSENSWDVPWFNVLGNQDSALHSVGTVPNIPNLATDSTYPPPGRYFGVGPMASIQGDLDAGGNGWGSGCSDFQIRECSTDADCAVGYFCLTQAGVCMSDDFRDGTYCYRHDMCVNGEMCDGTGRCASGYLVFLNTLNSSMEAQVFAEQCDETSSFSFKTDGSSPWEYVPDWLGGHGMCSNKNWYTYSINYLAQLSGNGQCTSTECTLDAGITPLPLNSSMWWPSGSPQPKLFPVLPTICDRDYEHMTGPSGVAMQGCAPKNTGSQGIGNGILDAFSNPLPLSYSGLFRNFDGKMTQLARMPYAISLNKTGFLGVPPSQLASSSGSPYIFNCELNQNCYAYPFTVNGLVPPKRVYRKDPARLVYSTYSNNDIFRCGVAAYFDNTTNKCKLDVQVLGLYQALCNTPSVINTCACKTQVKDAIGCAPVVDAVKLASVCLQINSAYQASYSTIHSNTKSLQALFGVFVRPEISLAAHISGVECFSAIYSVIQAPAAYSYQRLTGVYYPFDFVLFEVPLSWVYQCVYLGGIVIDSTSLGAPCYQYENAQTLSFAESFVGATRFNFDLVMAGYNRAEVLQGISDFTAYVQSGLPDPSTLDEVQQECMLPAGGKCDVVPYCAMRLDWVPHSTMTGTVLDFLVGFYNAISCSDDSKQYALSSSGLSFADFVLKWTTKMDFAVDPSVQTNGKKFGLPALSSLIWAALADCIAPLGFDVNQRMPLQFSFSQDFQNCMGIDRVLTTIVAHNPGIDINAAFSPTADSGVGVPVNLKLTPASQTGCIFNNLLQQMQAFQPDLTSLPNNCDFTSGTGACRVECFAYPLTFSTGQQACRYPLKQNFTNFGTKALITYLWSQLEPQFSANYKAMSAFTPPSPAPLDFFADAQAYFSGWTFDLTAVQSYLSNINPDTKKEVMCVPVDANQAVNFTVCNDANYAALGAFTQSLRQPAAPIVPDGAQLQWRVSRSFLAQGAMMAFANHTRPDEHVLLGNIFNTKTRCGVGENMQNRVCLAQVSGASVSSVRPWVPWLAGQWNPYEYCDVQMQGLDNGNQELIWPYDTANCPGCKDQGGQYRSAFMYDPLSPSCDARQRTYAKQQDVDPSAPTNLCYVQLRNTDQICTHAQGMLGGERGQSVLNHPQMPFLYGTTNLSVPAGSSGMFPRSPHTLLNGADADPGHYGFVSVPGDELGVTTIGMSIEPISGSLPYLRVSRLPLQASQGYLSQMESADVSSGWVRSLGAVYAAEDALHAAEQSSRTNSAWDCPMRRAAFYSRTVGQPFVPVVPSPGRSRRIFGRLTLNMSAHPTVAAQRDGAPLGEYSTSNGFCFCPANMSSDQVSCRVSLSNTVHNCSLKRTVDALSGLWVQSFVFPPTTPGGGDATCMMQFDWPYVGGALRDGTSYDGAYDGASDPLNRRCHLLDRLRPFLYRYKPVGSLPVVPGSSTLATGGVCHTGRAAQVNAENKAAISARVTTSRCVKQSEDDSNVYVKCEDGLSMTLAKEASTPLPEMVSAVRSSRQDCAKCSPPPTFVNSHDTAIKPESSFGIPFRFSAERAVAADLRHLLCPDYGTGTSTCPVRFNESAWANGRFLSSLLTSPSSLFLNSGTGAGGGGASGGISDPAWNSSWVFCNTSADLRTGKCNGSISESDWRANRFQSCYKTIRALTRDSPEAMSSVDVCLVDSSLSALCTAIKEAQSLVSEANCLASGDPSCILKPYMYQPGAWDVSNQEFVHQTVTRFYQRVTPYTCPQVSATVIANNQAILSRCPASAVTVMYLALQGCRDVVDAVAHVVFYGANILIGALQMAFSTDQAALKAQIAFYWEALKGVVEGLVVTLSDIFFDMLFNMGSMGGKVYDFVKKSCSYINTAYGYWLEVWCGIAIDLAPLALAGIRHLTEYAEVAFRVLNDSLEVIFRYLVPAAMQDIEAMGYTNDFRERDAKSQKGEKQTIHDNLVQSKKEGKSADQASNEAKKSALNKYSVFGLMNRNSWQNAAIGFGLGVLAERSPVTGMLVDAGTSMYEAIQSQALSALLPSNFTLFDFDSVYSAIDAFEYYVSSDSMCLNYRLSGIKQIIGCSFPPLTSFDSLHGAMMVATRCWADAQRDVGTSNLLACTGSDTCYKSATDPDTVVCASCPDYGQGYSLYGCSPSTRTCTCGVQVTHPDSCISNEQCYYASSTCLLITGQDLVSYGNQPCAQCSKQVQCIVRDGSGVGSCACVFQPQPVQQCQQFPGKRVDIVAPNKMCGYLANADPTQSVATADWDTLALTQCLYLNFGAVYCVQVYQGGSATTMAVGLNMAALTTSFQSRRLLAEGQVLSGGAFELHNAESEYALPDTLAMHALLMEDWNNTAEPCSALVWAYQQATKQGAKGGAGLGPLDTTYLHQCVYWRQVGREAIADFNLSSLRNSEGFLLSMDDFAAALSQKSVLVELIRKPEALLFAMGRMPILKPLYAAGLAARSLSVSILMSLAERDKQLTNSTRWGNTSLSVRYPWAFNASDLASLEEPPLHEIWRSAWELVSGPRLVPKTHRSGCHTKQCRNESQGRHRNSSHAPGRRGRALLQSPDLNMAQNWLTGPFTWPPTYIESLRLQECSAGSAIVQILHDILAVLVSFYYDSYSRPPPPPRTLVGNLPVLTPARAEDMHSGTEVQGEGWIAATYHAIWSFVGLDPAYVRGFLSNQPGTTNIFTVSTTMIQCDFAAVTFCSNHKKDLMASAILLGLLYMIIAYIGGLLGIPILGIAFVFVFTPVLLWYAYGLAFTCFPMLPTCLMDDVVSFLNETFPLYLTVPAELSVADNCLGDSNYTSCFRPCTDSPMDFKGWRDTFSYALCSLSVDWCRSLADKIGERDSLSGALRSKANAVATGGESLLAAMDICLGVTFVNLVPLVVLLIVALACGGYLLYLPCAVVPRFLVMLAQALVYTHTDGSGSE